MEINLSLNRYSSIDPLHRSHNARVPNAITHHFVTEMCICVHISVTKWCIVGYLPDALWDLWYGSIPQFCNTPHLDKFLTQRLWIGSFTNISVYKCTTHVQFITMGQLKRWEMWNYVTNLWILSFRTPVITSASKTVGIISGWFYLLILAVRFDYQIFITLHIQILTKLQSFHNWILCLCSNGASPIYVSLSNLGQMRHICIS